MSGTLESSRAPLRTASSSFTTWRTQWFGGFRLAFGDLGLGFRVSFVGSDEVRCVNKQELGFEFAHDGRLEEFGGLLCDPFCSIH